MDPLLGTWHGTSAVGAAFFKCGHCGRDSGSSTGYVVARSAPSQRIPLAQVRICQACNRPTYYEGETRVPGEPVGRVIQHLPAVVGLLWEEARNAARANAHSACVMICRSLIMHVAVEKGAPRSGGFASFVKYLADEHYVPRGAAGWVDRVRLLGNDAAHELVVMTREQMLEAMKFTQALLEMTYELEGSLPPAQAAG